MQSFGTKPIYEGTVSALEDMEYHVLQGYQIHHVTMTGANRLRPASSHLATEYIYEA